MDSTSINGSNDNAGNVRPTEGVLNQAASGAHAAVDRAAGAISGAAQNAKPTIDRVAGNAHQAVDKAAGAAAPAANWLDEHGHDLKATQEKLMAATCDYMKAHPWKSVGVALVAGFLISRVVL